MAEILYERTDQNPPRMHLQVRRGEIGEYVIMPGDPFRCETIASYLDDPRLIAHNREHKTYTGMYRGIAVSITSTGMGCPSAAIAAEELWQCGAKVLIRLGGGLLVQPQKIHPGDIAVTLASMKCEGTTKFFVPDCFPAAADPDVVMALIRSGKEYLKDTPFSLHTGITATIDGFYGETPDMLQKFRELGIMNVEMESAAILTVAQQHHIKAGCICACGKDDNTAAGKREREQTTHRQIHITLDAIWRLHQVRTAGGEIVKEGR